MKHQTLALCGILGMFFCGCVDTPKPVSPPRVEAPVSPKQLDIPHYGQEHRIYPGKPVVYYTFAKQRERQLELSAPEFSGDEFLLRVWWTWQRGASQSGSLREFKKSNGEWQARVIRYNVVFDGFRHYEKISDVRSREFTPLGGWEKFESMMDAHLISMLPTSDAVEGYNLAMYEFLRDKPAQPTTTYSVEIATPEHYRFYFYDSPALIRDKIREADLLASFIDALRDMETRP